MSPAFASVITRFVTNNNIQHTLDSIDNRVEKLDAGNKAINKRLDTVFNRLDKIEKEKS